MYKYIVIIYVYNVYAYIYKETVVRLVAEWSETQSNVKLDGFRSRLRASCVSSHTEEFW